MLFDDIRTITSLPICSDEIRTRFLERLEEGAMTRDENPQTHYGVYFLPYDRQERKVFIVHHKKSGLWLAPGGHIDRDEGVFEALNREIGEELGMKDFFQKPPDPFLLTITPIEDESRPCQAHYDVWHLIPTDGTDFDVDPREFHNTRWMTLEEAEGIIIDASNREALEVLKKEH